MGKIGTWASGDKPHEWPTETIMGAAWAHWRDWPGNVQTRDIGNGQFVLLDFGIKKTDFDIEAAIAELKPKAARRGDSE